MKATKRIRLPSSITRRQLANLSASVAERDLRLTKLETELRTADLEQIALRRQATEMRAKIDALKAENEKLERERHEYQERSFHLDSILGKLKERALVLEGYRMRALDEDARQQGVPPFSRADEQERAEAAKVGLERALMGDGQIVASQLHDEAFHRMRQRSGY